MELRILIAGLGGQGILFMGELLSWSAMYEGYQITSFPSYGVEKIGGFARCSIIVSDEIIGCPVIEHIDILIAMHISALNRFSQKIVPKGMLFCDSSIDEVKTIEPSVKLIRVPAFETAMRFNALRSANMVMLGAFCAETSLIGLKTLQKALKLRTPTHRKDSYGINKRLIEMGYRLIEDQKGKDS